jgi:hypothetical protein
MTRESSATAPDPLAQRLEAPPWPLLDVGAMMCSLCISRSGRSLVSLTASLADRLFAPPCRQHQMWMRFTHMHVCTMIKRKVSGRFGSGTLLCVLKLAVCNIASNGVGRATGRPRRPYFATRTRDVERM